MEQGRPPATLPASIVPILESVVRAPGIARGLPLEFWRHEDHRTWIDAFMELAVALWLCDLAEDELPRGYGLIAHLFDWEAQCQSSGFHAFSNRAAEMERIILSYEAVGLDGEAAALKRAFAVWRDTDGDHEATVAAYDGVPHAYTVDLDRLEYLAAHFVDHADDLLYEPPEGLPG